MNAAERRALSLWIRQLADLINTLDTYRSSHHDTQATLEDDEEATEAQEAIETVISAYDEMIDLTESLLEKMQGMMPDE